MRRLLSICALFVLAFSLTPIITADPAVAAPRACKPGEQPVETRSYDAKTKKMTSKVSCTASASASASASGSGSASAAAAPPTCQPGEQPYEKRSYDVTTKKMTSVFSCSPAPAAATPGPAFPAREAVPSTHPLAPPTIQDFDLPKCQPGSPPHKACVPGIAQMPVFFSMTQGLMKYALLGCLAAILISSSMWAIGAKSGNEDQTFNGKRGIFAGVLGAFAIGAVVPIINFLVRTGNDFLR